MSEKSGKSETSTSGIESGYCEKYDNSRSGGESETCEKYGDSGRGREEILKTVTNLRLLDLEDILEATQHLWRIQMMRRNMRLLGQLEQNIESVEKEDRGGGLEQKSEREGEYRKRMEQNETSGTRTKHGNLWMGERGWGDRSKHEGTSAESKDSGKTRKYRKSMEQNESSGNGANNWKLWRL